MDIDATKQGEIIAALRRAAIVDAGSTRRLSAAHLLQFAGTILLGVALLLGHLVASLALGLGGALALAIALRRNPSSPEPEIDGHFDERSGLALASALAVVVRDDQATASLTGITQAKPTWASIT